MATASSSFTSNNLYLALNLAERASFWQDAVHLRPDALDEVMATRRFDFWRTNILRKPGTFEARLSALGLQEADFRSLLGLSGTQLKDLSRGHIPLWLEDFLSAYDSHVGRIVPASGSGPAGPPAVAEPLVLIGEKRLRIRLEELGRLSGIDPHQTARFTAAWMAMLRWRVLGCCGRMLLLELNVARLRGQLWGTTPESRFESFHQLLYEPNYSRSLLLEYPVLARKLVGIVRNCIDFGIEVAEHICSDGTLIAHVLGGTDPGFPVAIENDMGDFHRGGRCVILLRFSNGQRIVYKPRDLSVDVHFTELLKWIEDKGLRPALTTPRVINRNGYGWTEFIKPRECSSLDEVSIFYRRQGMLLGILYVLNAGDFHFENIIARGAEPVPIDLETLFQSAGNDFEDVPIASKALLTSVLRVGLLPQRIWGGANATGIDLSGLGGPAGQMSPFEVSRLENDWTDEMRVKPGRVPIRARNNRPTLAGKPVALEEFTSEIIQGFGDIYQFMMRHREELLGFASPLHNFTHDTVRRVSRPTRHYALALTDSYHPDLLRDAAYHDLHLDHMVLGYDSASLGAKIAASEARELWDGDVPMWLTQPGSRDVEIGDTKIAGFLPETGLEAVQTCLRGLDDTGLVRQTWIINASISSMSLQWHRESKTAVEPPKVMSATKTVDAMTAVNRVADRLKELALIDESQIGWIGLTFFEDNSWTLAPALDDLYSGLQGPLLFFAQLGAATGKQEHVDFALRILRSLRKYVSAYPDSQHPAPGAFNGRGSLVYTFGVLNRLWNDAEISRDLDAAIARVASSGPEVVHADIIVGCAGAILALLAAHQMNPTDLGALAAAIHHGDRLLELAVPTEVGLGWPNAEGEILLGMAHGTAGIALSLQRLAFETGEERFRKAASGALKHERALFDTKTGNWPDFRLKAKTDTPSGNMVAWCHGAVGIGLARLNSPESMWDEETEKEIQIATRTTADSAFGFDHCICHGDLGNLELLMQATQRLSMPSIKSFAERQARIIVDQIVSGPLRCGTPRSVETPGMMTGLSGIGHGLLRLAYPGLLPSILTLDPLKT